MRLDIDTFDGTRIVTVRLSRRNLLSLLSKLDMAGSARTLMSDNCWEDGECAALCFTSGTDAAVPPTTLVAISEDDPEHYASRPFPPGDMHPATEQFVREHGGWSRTQG